VLGVGLGALFGNFTDSFATYHDTKGGYQATVGVAFKAGSRVNIDLYYRLQGSMGDFDVATSKVSYLSSNVLAGARFNF
jgi:opacity protein-like surface antigen